MKILALSLLRIGDILMHREIVRSIHAQYPQAEVHFLINQQFASVKELLPEVSVWKYLPRTQIQDVLVKRNQHVDHAHQLLTSVVKDLNQEKYDLVLNLTNNFLSVRLMDLIVAKEKRGSAFQDGRKVRDQNRWQTYLNDHFSVTNGSRFHYVEVLSRALGLEADRSTIRTHGKSNKIYFQLLTSDVKKNWGLSRFQKLIQALKFEMPQFEFIGLCSPAERDMVSVFFQPSEFISPSLKEASDLLSEARLLVTGDTSLLHLAAQARCETIAIFLGSADPVKTSAWQNGSTLLTSTVGCAPCTHSKPCSQKSHLCAEEISVARVLAMTKGILVGAPQRSFSSEFAKFETAVWFHYLENENQSQLPRFASIARETKFSRYEDWQKANETQKALEIATQDLKIAVDQTSRSLLVDQKSGNHARIDALVRGFIQKFSDQKDFVRQFLWAFENKNEFEMIKSYRKAWLELSELIEIRGKILNTARGLYVREPSASQEHSAET